MKQDRLLPILLLVILSSLPLSYASNHANTIQEGVERGLTNDQVRAPSNTSVGEANTPDIISQRRALAIAKENLGATEEWMYEGGERRGVMYAFEFNAEMIAATVRVNGVTESVAISRSVIDEENSSQSDMHGRLNEAQATIEGLKRTISELRSQLTADNTSQEQNTSSVNKITTERAVSEENIRSGRVNSTTNNQREAAGQDVRANAESDKPPGFVSRILQSMFG